MPHGLAQTYGLRGGLYKVFDESKNCNACGLKFSLTNSFISQTALFLLERKKFANTISAEKITLGNI